MKYLHLIIGCACILLFSSNTIAQSTVTASTVIEQINRGEDVSYRNVRIIGDLLFTDVQDRTKDEEHGGSWNKKGWDRKAYICHVRSKITFENCTFAGEVSGYLNDEDKDELYNANFYKSVTFKECIFKDDANFKYSDFPKATTFEGSTFEEEAFFKYSHFNDDISFADVDFEGEATFKYTEFPNGVNFKNANFRNDANFKYTKFPKGVDFTNVIFKRDANFKYAKFRDPSHFKNTDFGSRADFKYTKINGRSFVSYLLENRKN